MTVLSLCCAVCLIPHLTAPRRSLARPTKAAYHLEQNIAFGNVFS